MTAGNKKIIKEWQKYERNVASARKPYDDAVNKEPELKPLGPASPALLDHVNNSFGNIPAGTCITWVKRKTKFGHSHVWWLTLLHALAHEGRISVRIYRTEDKVITFFRKNKETE